MPTNKPGYGRSWRAANIDRVRETDREAHRRYYEKHRDAVKAKTAARQAKRSAEVKAQRIKDRPLLDAIDGTQAHMTYEEIAAKLGISKARVGQLVASALRKLRARNPQLAELFAPE